MAGKQMGGDNTERRKNAKAARDAGKMPSEIGATFGAPKQRTKASGDMTHQERLDLTKEGKRHGTGQHIPEARPGNRDPETEDRERFPRK